MSKIFMRVVDSTTGLGNTEYSLIDGDGLLKFDKAAMDECCEKINTHDTLIAQVAELRAVVYEANKYLDINNLTTIGHGSKLHEWFKQALEAGNDNT